MAENPTKVTSSSQEQPWSVIVRKDGRWRKPSLAGGFLFLQADIVIKPTKLCLKIHNKQSLYGVGNLLRK